MTYDVARRFYPALSGIRRGHVNRVGGQFGAIVANDRPRVAAHSHEPVQFPRQPHSGQRFVGRQRQTSPVAVVDYRQASEVAAIDELIGNEVERPAVAGLQRQDRLALASSSPACDRHGVSTSAVPRDRGGTSVCGLQHSLPGATESAAVGIQSAGACRRESLHPLARQVVVAWPSSRMPSLAGQIFAKFLQDRIKIILDE